MKDLSLTTRHYKIIESTLCELQGSIWSFEAPVFIFDRCWLRLEKIRFHELTQRLPPDNSAEAPELIRYKHLLLEKNDRLLALQECWFEFGMEDFYRAFRSYWEYQEKGNQGWTFSRYLDTLNKYRESFEISSISVPLIVLTREHTADEHLVEWIVKADLHEELVISN